MRFAFETVIWGRQLDDVELVLDTIAACGYEGVEFAQSPEEIFVRDTGALDGRRPIASIEELLSLLSARRLNLVGLAGGTLTRRMEFCGQFRPDFLYVEDWQEGDEEARRAVTARPPFKLSLHPHWFMKVQRAGQVKDRLKKFSEVHPGNRSLGFVPDTAHATIVGDDPAKAVEELFDDLVGVHIKDWRPNYGRYSHRYAQGFVPLGSGMVHPEKTLQVLREKSYVGWVVVEQDYAYHSAAESAKKNADWLIEQGWMGPPLGPRPSFATVKEQEDASRPVELSPAANQRAMAFLDCARPATIRGSALFYQAAVEAIHRRGGLDAVKLYGYSSHNGQLCVLGLAGVPGYPCRSVVEADTGLYRKVIRDSQIQELDLTCPDNRAQFGDDRFLDQLVGKRMVTVPIFNASNPHHLRFLLNLFPTDASYWGALPAGRSELTRLAAHLSRLADYVADDVCSAAAQETSHICGHSTSKKEFLTQLVSLVQRQFNCEGVSVFLVNETGDRLELPEGGTTSNVWNPKLKEHEHHYQIGVGRIGFVWATGGVQSLSETAKDGDRKERSWDKRESLDREECLFAPLAKLGDKVKGVIRLTNKRRPVGSRAATMFTDDDAAVLDAILHAALPYLELLTYQERQLSAVTRMVHEFQVPMVATRAAVDFMQHTLKAKQLTAKDVFDEDYLSDVMNWSLIMGRLANNARVFSAQPGSLPLRPTRTFLLKDVVAPAVHQVRPLLAEHGFDTRCISYSDFADVPALLVDRLQLQQVIFNLLANSIKYAVKSRLMIRIGAGQHGNAYSIWFQDWGMGIKPGTEELIFAPGYRSLEARRKDVGGQGIGLSVVRTIIEAHGGRVRLNRTSNPTMFEITLPLSLNPSVAPVKNDRGT